MKAKADTSQLFTRSTQLSAASVNTTHHPDIDAEIDYRKSVSVTLIPFSAYTVGHVQYEDSSASKDFSLSYNSSDAVEEYELTHFKGNTQPFGYSYNNAPKYLSFEQGVTMRFRHQTGNGYPSTRDIGEGTDRSSVAHTYGHGNAVDERLRLVHLLVGISQVMARNVSHNIGSHVLSGLSNSESIKKLLSGINSPGKKDQQYRALPQLAYNKQTDSVGEEHLANLYSYLGVRMDFLADLVTGPPSLESSRMLLQEVMAGLDKNRILLNRISGIDDFGFRFVIRDCRHLSEGQSIDDAPEFTSATDIPVVMVNDIFGQHAFYVILENIIRNMAKHACIEKGTEVVFTIAISECVEDHTLYKCTIYDNCAAAGTCLDELVVAMNNRINQSFLKNDFTLREGAWGLIEMAVSAAYLRKMKITDAEGSISDHSFETGKEDEYEQIAIARDRISILKAVKQGCYLGYEVYLPKPQELLIIDEYGQAWKDRFWQHGELDVAALKELESNGISYMHCMDDKEISAWRWAVEKKRSQQLLILISPTDSRRYNHPSQRIITQAELEKYHAAYHHAGQHKTDDLPYIWDLLRENKGRQFIEEAWRCLIGKMMAEKRITGISPHMNYSHFVAPCQHSGHILNVALDDHAQNIKTALGKNDFYQAFNHLTRDLIKNRVNPYVNGRLKAQFDFRELFCFMESILTNVLIIDERIQKAFYTNMHAGIKKPIGFIAKKSFVYCPGPGEIDLSQQSFASDIRENISAYLQQLFTEQKKLKGLDIAVIHLGIIEKIMKSEGQGKTRKNISDFIACFKKEAEKIFGHEPCVIITSGRGTPENVPGNIPFISYSILSQFLIDNQSKSLLTQALYSARPKI